jgi:WD40 repeat protein
VNLRLIILIFYCCLAKTNAQTPTLTIPFGHKNVSDINVIAISNDDDFMASAALGDEAAVVWSLKHKCMLYRLEGHKGPIKKLVFCKNGKYLVSYSQDNTIRLWDIFLGKCLQVINTQNLLLTDIKISPDGNYIVTQSDMPDVYVYNTNNTSINYKLGKEGKFDIGQDSRHLILNSFNHLIIRSLNNGLLIDSISIYRNWAKSTFCINDSVVLLRTNESVIIYNILAKELVLRKDLNFYQNVNLQLTSDRKKLFSIVYDTLWQFDIQNQLKSSFIILKDFEGKNRPNTDVVFDKDIWPNADDRTPYLYTYNLSFDGRFVTISDDEGIYYIYNSSGDLIKSYTTKTDTKWNTNLSSYALTCSSSSSICALADFNGIYIVNLNDLNDIIHFEKAKFQSTRIHVNENTNSLIEGTNTGVVKFWDLKTGLLKSSFRGVDYSSISELSQDSVNDYYAILGLENVFLLDKKTDSLIANYGLPKGTVSFNKIDMSPTGKHLAIFAIDSNQKHFLYMFNIQKRDLPFVTEVKYGQGYFNYRGDEFVCVLGETFDVTTGKKLDKFKKCFKNIQFVAPRWDRKLLSIFRDDRIDFLDMDKVKIVQTIKHDNVTNYMHYFSNSLDGRFLALGSQSLQKDKSTKYSLIAWDFASGKKLLDTSDAFGYGYYTAYSKDGDYLYTTNWSGLLQIWSTKNWQMLHEIPSAGGSPPSFYKDMTIFAGMQGKFSFIDNATFENRIGLYVFEDEYVHIHPSGLFDASPGAMNKIYFVVPDTSDISDPVKVIALDQLKHRYWVPGLWEKVIKKEPLPTTDAFKELKLWPNLETKIINNKLNILVLPRNGGIGKISLSIEGKEVIESITIENNSAEIDLTAYNSLFRFDTINNLELIAWNQEHYLKSTPYSLFYQPKKSKGLEIEELFDSSEVYQPKFYGLCIGISDYQGDNIDLTYASKDAEDMAKAIEMGANRLFGADNAKLWLLSSNSVVKPTKNNINAYFDSLKQANIDDVVFIYLSGHGINKFDEFYYLSNEAQGASAAYFVDQEFAESVALSASTMSAYLNKIAARKIYIVIDACNSGKGAEQISALAAREVNSTQQRALDRMKDKSSIYILAGSAADKPSYEASRYGQGLLTYAMLKGLKGAALVQDGSNFLADVIEISKYAQNEVLVLAKEISGIQNPQLLSPSNQSTFYFASMDEKAKQAIVLNEAKPVFCYPNFQDISKPFDQLKFSEIMMETMVQNHSKGSDSKIAVVQSRDYNNGFIIAGRYKITDNDVQFFITLYKQGTDILEIDKFEITGTLDALNKASIDILQKAVAIIGTVK